MGGNFNTYVFVVHKKDKKSYMRTQRLEIVT